MLSGLEEDLYRVETYTQDFSEGTIHKYHLLNYFTSSGPVLIEEYEIPQQSENRFTLIYSLRNDGSTDTATNVSVELFTSDTNVTNIIGTPYYGNIAPGQVKSSSSNPHVIYTQNNPSSVDIKARIFSNDNYLWSDSITVTGLTAIEENENNLPAEFALLQNNPNPFNLSTLIQYSLPETSNVSLKIYNTSGQEIATLVDGHQQAGRYEVTFNTENLQRGLYFYSITANDYALVKKMLIR